MSDSIEGLVTRAVSGFFTVRTDAGEILTCKLRGKLKQERQKSELAVAGDRVRVEPTDAGEGVIDAVLERRSWIMRREPGPRGKHFDDLVVANVDVLVICGAATDPPLQPGLVDRFLVAAALGNVAGLLAVTKRDALDDASAEAATLRDTLEVYRRIGVPVIETSARSGVGIDALREALRGKISAFMGKSGAGKSSLVNALDPSLSLAVGEISGTSKKGLHTTRVATLHPFGEGWLVDTPGLRELALPELDVATLTSLYPELAALGMCQFTNCRHTREPGCVVRPAIERGEIAAFRLDSFRKLLET
ncbi:MAG: ribosome small subunit-dependent GTPase A [Deltaproteobacteria bacterium]|nr:ribosome small subunit-dependent GTPase A [Deltaproteobacteria bacterium]